MAKSFKELFAKAKDSAEYWAELAALDFTANLQQTMQALNVTRTELAARIDTSPAYVTKVMNGSTNFTLKTMAILAHALGQKVRIVLENEALDDDLLRNGFLYRKNQSIAPRGHLILLTQYQPVEIDAMNESSISSLRQKVA
jgi:transcriptional regulator with XRE-family HTH domain